MSARKPFIRQSRPDYSLGLFGANGGLGPIPRRGWDAASARLMALAETRRGNFAGLRHFFQTSPLRLLKILLSVHPMAKMAHSNNAGDICLPGSSRPVAYRKVTKVNEKTGETETSEEIDTEETDAAEAYLKAYPGGLPAKQRALLKMLEWAGMYVIEGIPAGRGKGLSRGVTVDPVSIVFYDQPDGSREIRQLVTADWARNLTDVAGARTIIGGGGSLSEVVLDPATTFALALDYDDDNPYGDPWFGPFLVEGLKDLGQERNLSDILRAWAYPHLSIGFPVDETLERAKNNKELLAGKGPIGEDGEYADLSPEEYVEEEFFRFMQWLSTVNPDDPLVFPKGTEAKVLEGGGSMGALDPVLRMRRLRMIMSLDQMPNRVGITDGGTQSYAKEQGKGDSRKLEFARFIINVGIEWELNLNARLRGKQVTIRIETDSIIPDDKLTEARARALDVQTDYVLVDRGAEDPERVAQRHTGSAAHDPSRSYNGANNASTTQGDPSDSEDDNEDDDPPADDSNGNGNGGE